MIKKTTVLLAEDDLQLAFIIKDNLEEEGYAVINCPDGDEAWLEFQKHHPDICLLDVNMPCRDGFSLAKKIRDKNDVVPILFITAKHMQEDKLKGFDSGGDDFITKPFHMPELLKRMQVFLRRNKMMLPTYEDSYIIGSLTFLPRQNKLTAGEREIFITEKENQLLLFFCQHANMVLKRGEILIHVWGKDDYFLGRSMDVFITRLRKLFKEEGGASIDTIPHVGYRFVV
jgi:DNA-binding response OmpR family regulator